ncbi:MAG: hypothetical protein APF80_06560 [Alphaproteobacteria bacterium BRH_c36]|nr:MAG: hypothetical protein APF80_06560 [Alphaproteobacteria bacterium BRH_c36]
MNVMSFTRAAVLGGAVAFAALAGGTGQSEAAGFKGLSNLNAGFTQSEVQKVGHRHRRSGIHLFHKRHDGCGFYKWKWLHTGSFYWKKRYFICKGWW